MKGSRRFTTTPIERTRTNSTHSMNLFIKPSNLVEENQSKKRTDSLVPSSAKLTDNLLKIGKNQHTENNIKVVCRVRPLNSKEKEYSDTTCIEKLNENTIKINTNDKESCNKANSHVFTFDGIFSSESTQIEMYTSTAKPIVESFIAGFNGTILAYGQTSSGKSHTMQGVLDSPEFKGLTPRIIEEIFSALDKLENINYQVFISVFEIYQEKLKDLLNHNNSNLNIREQKNKGVFIENLMEKEIKNASKAMSLINESISNRTVSSTNMNEYSSRSHLIFLIQLVQLNNDDLSKKSSKLYLVDLAGSEKVSKTGAVGTTLEEAKGINKSLTTLGMVINALTENNPNTHIPYRNSKLTRVLSESLGGNSKTSLIITLSPSIYNDAESLSSLRFGIRAKKIKNKAKINKETSIDELKLEIDKLKEYCFKLEWKHERIVKYLVKQGVKLPSEEELNTTTNTIKDKENNNKDTEMHKDKDKDKDLVPIEHPKKNPQLPLLEKHYEGEDFSNGGFLDEEGDKLNLNTISEEEAFLEETFINTPLSNIRPNYDKENSSSVPLLAIDRNKPSILDETTKVNSIKEINEINDIRVKYVELLYIINQIEEEKATLKNQLEGQKQKKYSKYEIERTIDFKYEIKTSIINNNNYITLNAFNEEKQSNTENILNVNDSLIKADPNKNNNNNNNYNNNINASSKLDLKDNSAKSSFMTINENFFDVMEEMLYDLDHIHFKNPNLTEVTDMIKIYKDKFSKLKILNNEETNKKELGMIKENGFKDNITNNINIDNCNYINNQLVYRELESRASKLVKFHINNKPGIKNVIYNPTFVNWNLNNFKHRFKNLNNN